MMEKRTPSWYLDVEPEDIDGSELVANLYDKNIKHYNKDFLGAQAHLSAILSGLDQRIEHEERLLGYALKKLKSILLRDYLEEVEYENKQNEEAKYKSQGQIADYIRETIEYLEKNFDVMLSRPGKSQSVYREFIRRMKKVHQAVYDTPYKGQGVNKFLRANRHYINLVRLDATLAATNRALRRIMESNYQHPINERFKDLPKEEQEEIVGTGGAPETFQKAKTEKWFFELFSQKDGEYQRNGKPYFGKIDQELIKKHKLDPESDGEPSVDTIKNHRRALNLMEYNFKGGE